MEKTLEFEYEKLRHFLNDVLLNVFSLGLALLVRYIFKDHVCNVAYRSAVLLKNHTVNI